MKLKNKIDRWKAYDFDVDVFQYFCNQIDLEISSKFENKWSVWKSGCISLTSYGIT
eukprot:m.147746 g.147746  ORF g.147746 m.147746 type:complete len:56 (+) comp30557_c0_seq3:123-290(+)